MAQQRHPLSNARHPEEKQTESNTCKNLQKIHYTPFGCVSKCPPANLSAR